MEENKKITKSTTMQATQIDKILPKPSDSKPPLNKEKPASNSPLKKMATQKVN